ncbi:hypothetical protein [uncultured Piscinibacter sp.]|uniref:hypothetical protein n=1 Tax=uncultured Piscinibacter sp. TaxID=1131835 RepID=UPI00260577EA|nr:hypothetical protein [uncultured Piscinibacter sp.]
MLTLPMAVAAAVAGHYLASRAVKAVLWSVSPLSTGEPQAFAYERDVYRTAEMATMQIVVGALVSGLVVWLGGVTGAGWLVGLGLLAWVGVLALDLLRWERVAVSANNLWFQRGLGQKVHQVAYENIRDVHIEEKDASGFTLRHGRHNRVCRLQVRMKDKRIVALPKTDAQSGLGDVEAVANQLRQRLRHLEDREAMQRSEHAAQDAVAAAAQTPASGDAELRLALRKLRAGALAPDVPKAVKLRNDS